MAIASYRQTPIALSQDEYFALMQESLAEDPDFVETDFASDEFDFAWSYCLRSNWLPLRVALSTSDFLMG
jgi:hypothetical protein